jgi:lipopolysaccharide/colanic/teichoic acid biosynthesis glycosyltransferase
MISRAYPLIKRAVDVILATIGLIFSLPLWAVVALLVKIEDGGPVLYRGVRVGRHGRTFTIYKFRTMVVDAEQVGGSSTSDQDPRLTRVGRVLRARKFDELPQLLNVLRGEMSIVGPRPQVPWDVDRYTAAERRLLEVKPGITDWSSIRFHDEGAILATEDDPDEAYDRLIRPEKIRLGLEYVSRASLATDVRIIQETLLVLLSRKPRLP